MPAEPERWYPTKVDWWLGVLLVFPPIGCAVAIAGELARGNSSGAVIGAAATVLLVLVYGGLVFPMRYGITDAEIVVRHGVVRQRIPLADIELVYPTRNPLSSPALSLDRLFIKFGEGFTKSAMISPADKAGFLAELAEKAKLRPDGDKLVR